MAVKKETQIHPLCKQFGNVTVARFKVGGHANESGLAGQFLNFDS